MRSKEVKQLYFVKNIALHAVSTRSLLCLSKIPKIVQEMFVFSFIQLVV